MKKILTLVMVATVAFAALSCTKNSTETKVSIPAAANKADAKKITLDETVYVGSERSLSKIEFTDGGRYLLTFVTTKAVKEEYLTGSYTVVNNVYVLEDFGTITVEENNITIEVTGEPAIETTGTIETPNEEMEEIAQAWEVDKIDVSVKGSKGNIGFVKEGCNLEKIALELISQAEKLGYNLTIDLGKFSGLSIKYVSFSSSGTFLVEFDNDSAYVGEMSGFKEDTGGYSFHYDLKNTGNEILNGSADCKFQPVDSNTAWLTVNVTVNENTKGRVIFIMSKSS